MYWSEELNTRNELIVRSMRRNRFDEIMRHIHASDNDSLCMDDRFAKVRPLLTALNGKFLEFGAVFGPCKVSIDESMIRSFGRHPTKQFIRGKPIRWGYKARVAASSFGYVCQLDVYQGKETGCNDIYKEEFGLGGNVILNFLDTLELAFPQRKFSLYFDNFFTSLKL